MADQKQALAHYLCNPINYSYQYQFHKQPDGGVIACREGADPSMVYFGEKYLIFPSMTCGFLYSDDLAHWAFHPMKNMPVYDYAPDVRVVGDWLYFCASNHEKGVHYRTRDPFSDHYERIDGAFPFWDPNLFCDDDGRLYFYWGSSTREPIYGIQLDRDTLQPIGEKVGLFAANPEMKGFERAGENHIPERSPEEQRMMLAHLDSAPMPESMKAAARDYITCAPYIEGAWMTKHNGKYYLQYGASGSRFNVYGDGVYVSRNPLGPFTLAKNNPFSYKPGGFLPGAGHGSTLETPDGSVWHVATSRIIVNHNFERRIGLWRAGWDADGEMFCNQRFGDWVYRVEALRENAWAEPEWMLLSYGKAAAASSSAAGNAPSSVTDEDIRTFWKAESNSPGEWVQVDLGKTYDVRAIQVNFADDHIRPAMPEGAAFHGALHQERWIDARHQPTRWLLESSLDGESWYTLEDKSAADTDLPHDLVVAEDGTPARFLRLTVISLPYGQPACVSGLRVFGLGGGEKPAAAADVTARIVNNLNCEVSWTGSATGYNVLWGYAPDKLYHSYLVFGEHGNIGSLVRGQSLYIRVDSFNDNGITKGSVLCVKE